MLIISSVQTELRHHLYLGFKFPDLHNSQVPAFRMEETLKESLEIRYTIPDIFHALLKPLWEGLLFIFMTIFPTLSWRFDCERQSKESDMSDIG